MGSIHELHDRPRMPVATRSCCGLSDEQYALEVAAMKRLKAAELEMDLAIAQVNADSGFRTINVTEWDKFRHDEFPDCDMWENRINEVRRGG